MLQLLNFFWGGGGGVEFNVVFISMQFLIVKLARRNHKKKTKNKNHITFCFLLVLVDIGHSTWAILSASAA